MAAAPACDGSLRVDGNVQLEWLSPGLSNYLIRQVDTFDQVVFLWLKRQELSICHWKITLGHTNPELPEISAYSDLMVQFFCFRPPYKGR